MSYECLLAGLPELFSGAEAPITMEQLNQLLEETLSDRDKNIFKLVRMTNNDPVVLEIKEQYEDTIIGQPDWWEDAVSVLSDEDLRTQILYEYGLHNGNKFLREWFQFNQDINNILAATICRKHGFDVRKAIVGTNEVANILRKDKQQKDFGLAGVVDNLDEIMALVEIDNLMEREKHTDALRFAWLEENTRMVNFTLTNVIAYYLELQMLNRWSVLTVEQGERIFRELVAEMKRDIKF